jgi:HicB family.
MPAKIKTEILQVRISPEVKSKAESKAASLGLSLSEYVRHLIMMDTNASSTT